MKSRDNCSKVGEVCSDRNDNKIFRRTAAIIENSGDFKEKDVIILEGRVGAGKTTFTKGLPKVLE